MTGISLEVLGMTQAELQERVVEKIANDVFLQNAYDPDEGDFRADSKFGRELQKLVKERIGAKISELAEKFVLPDVSKYIEELTIQETNQWGEKRGESITFIEYLVQRAKHYLNEKVNYEGKNKDECGIYSFNGTQTRLTHLVHKHLHFSIEGAMKTAVSSVNALIVPALEETCKTKLSEISATLKTTVKID